MNKKIIWAIIVLIVFGGGYYFLNKKSDMKNYDSDNSTMQTQKSEDEDEGKKGAQATAPSTNPAPKAPTVSSTPQPTKTYTFSDIASHSSKASCWSAIEGKVYDLTSFITKHPGGAGAILAICGKDGSQLFDGQHGMDPRAKGLLPNFYLGDLAN